VARESGLKPFWADLVALVAVTSFAPLSVMLEGGYGQFVTLPFFVLAMAGLQRKNFDNDSFIFTLALVVVAALSSYLDLLYLAGPMLLGTYVVGLLTRQYPLLVLSRKTLALTVGSFALSFPMISQIWRLVESAASNPRLGGWHQGDVFLPSNIFGFFSNLPIGRYEISQRTALDLWIDVLLSALTIAIVFLAPHRQRILGAFLLLGFAYLTYTVYSTTDDLNNYRLWKYSAYAAVLFSFILIGALSRISTKKKQNMSRLEARMSLVLAASLATLSSSAFLSSGYYAIDWINSSSFTATKNDASLIRKLSPDFDLAFGGGLYSTMYTMYGDVRFAALNRGGPEIGNVLRDPGRPLAVVLPKGMIATLEVLNSVADGNSYSRFRTLYQGDSISAYELIRN
jgi:hypothetical protein